MSTPPEARIATLRTAVAQAQQARARAEAQRDGAAADHEAAVATLHTHFDVDTVEDARAKLAEGDAAIEKLIADAEGALARSAP